MAMRRLETDEQRSFIRIDGQSMEPTRVRLAFPPMRTGPERRPYGFAVGGVWIDGERQFSIGVYVSDNWLFTVPERNGLSESLYSHLEKVVSSDVAHGDALPAGSGRLEQLGTVRWPHGAQMLQHVDWAARQVRELPDAYVDSQTPIVASGVAPL
jgi:hypothetical protein